MLSEQELEELFVRFDTPEEGRKRIRWIRANAPIRRTEGGKRSVKVRYVSCKMGFAIEAEAEKTEYAALRTFDHDDETYEIYSQPTVLQLSYVGSNGKKKTFAITPDFFLIRKDGFQFIECKPENELEILAIKDPKRLQRIDKGVWKSPPADIAARVFGCNFRIRSSAENCPVLVNNLEFLEDYLKHPNASIASDAMAVVQDIIERKKWETARGLVDALKSCGHQSDTLYHMIVQGYVYFDIEAYALSNFENALVFRRKDDSKIYGLFAKSAVMDMGWRNPSLRLSPGSQFDWDGARWQILNVGQSKITAREATATGKKAKFITFDYDLMQSLALEGGFSAVQQPEELETIEAVSNKLLRQCSDQQLKTATLRYRILFEKIDHEFCIRSVKSWRSKYRAAQSRYHNGLLGLVPDLDRARGNRTRRISPDVLEKIEELAAEWAVPHQPTINSLYGKLRLFCQNIGADHISAKTFAKEIRRHTDAKAMIRRYGSKRMYVEEVPFLALEYATPRHGDRPFKIGHIDHTPIELALLDQSAALVQQSVWLTLLIDAYSRCILAWHFSFDPPSYRSCMMVLRDCIRRHGRLPQFIVSDQGSDFRSEYYETLLARFGTHKKERPGGRPRFGSVIERVFDTTQSQFIYNLRGNRQASRFHRQVTKAVDPITHAIWTYADLEVWFEGYLCDVYHQNNHSTLGTSPDNAFKAGLEDFGHREHTLIPFNSDVIALTCPTTSKGTARVSAQGVKINYCYFSCAALADRRHFETDVPVRYDPYDFGHAYVYVDGAWQECHSQFRAIFQNYSEKAVHLAATEFRLKAREAGHRTALNAERLAAFLMTLEPVEEVLHQRRLDAETVQARLKLSSPAPVADADAVHSEEIPNCQSPSQSNSFAEFPAPSLLEEF